MRRTMMWMAAGAVALGAMLPAVTAAPAGAAPGDSYRGLAPARLMDTRPGKTTVDAQSAGAGQYVGSRVLKVTGRGGVPSTGVAAVAINLTATQTSNVGYTTVFPNGQAKPLASTINFARGETIANTVVTAVGTNGSIVIDNSVSSHVLVDVVGWLPTGGNYSALTPARLNDTRANGTTVDGVAARTGGFTGTRTLKVTGRGGVPSTGVGSVAVNVTAIGTSTGAHTTAFASGQTPPNASSLNHVAGRAISNMVLTAVGADGTISLRNSVSAHLVIDIVGWWPTNSDYKGLAPARLNDTRPTGATVDNVAARTGAHNGTRTLKVTGRGGVPASGVGAVAVNVTVIGSVSGGYSTIFPTGQPRPNASTINGVPGRPIANMVITAVGTGGNISIDNYGSAQVIIDVVGWIPGTPLPAAPKAIDVAAGSGHSCAVTPAGGVKCWGENGSGQLGNNSRTRTATPVDVVGLSSGVKSVSTGTFSSCALTTAGAVKCWGTNTGWALGNGSTVMDSPVPVQVTGLTSGVASISSDSDRSCVVMTSGGVKCWGTNFFGQIGDGTKTDRPTPIDVPGLTGIEQISVGGSHTCSLSTAGAVKCWGSGTSGQLGNGGTVSSTVPVNVTGLGSGVTEISTGDASCAVLTTGKVRCWGANLVGTVGVGVTSGSVTTPTEVVGLSNAVSVTTTFSSSCGLTSGGALLCWGSNADGSIGDNTTTNRFTATPVQGLGSGVAKVSHGGSGVCALSTAGNVSCWGSNRGPFASNGIFLTDTLTPRAVPGLS